MKDKALAYGLGGVKSTSSTGTSDHSLHRPTLGRIIYGLGRLIRNGRAGRGGSRCLRGPSNVYLLIRLKVELARKLGSLLILNLDHPHKFSTDAPQPDALVDHELSSRGWDGNVDGDPFSSLKLGPRDLNHNWGG